MAGAEMHRDIQALTGRWSSGPPLPSLDLSGTPIKEKEETSQSKV